MKSRGRPFEPGNQYGRGRPKGSRNKMSKLAQALLATHSERIVGKCIAAAFQGDKQAMRLCMERIAPPSREAPVRLRLQPMETAQDVDAAFQRLLEAVSGGLITPTEGGHLAKMLEGRRKSIETAGFESRIRQLESDGERRGNTDEPLKGEFT